MMMTDDILGRKRRFEPSRKPIIKQYNTNISNLDPELKRLRYVMIRNTADNREYCFWNSSIAQSFSTITSSTIVGDGLRIRCTNPTAKSIIEDWNQEINVNGKSIEDYIWSSWIDELVHANDYWRIEINKDLTNKIDIQRVDPKTIIKLKDPKYGWTKLIQRVNNFKTYRSKAAFYARAGLNEQILTTYPWNTVDISIPDEPNVILRNSFFVRPPLASATHYIAYKRFILYFMRKYSERLWSPFLLFLVGDPKTNYYPDGDPEMQQAIDDVSEVIPDMVSFGGAALPGNIVPHEINKGSAKNSEVFVTYMEALDKQTMMSIFGSMGLRDASGNELATSRSLKESWLQFIGGIRRKYAVNLTRFYARCLLKQNGITLSPRDINIEFAPLKFEPTAEYMTGLKSAVECGLFKDRNELRKAGQTIWSWLEPLPAGQNTKLSQIMGSESTSTIDRYKNYNATKK